MLSVSFSNTISGKITMFQAASTIFTPPYVEMQLEGVGCSGQFSCFGENLHLKDCPECERSEMILLVFVLWLSGMQLFTRGTFASDDLSCYVGDARQSLVAALYQ